MVRRQDFSGATKTIPAGVASNSVWTASEVQSERVVGYHFVLTGGNTLADVTRIRIAANGADIFNLTVAQLRAYWQAFTWGTLTPALTDTAFTVPFALLDAPNPDQADTCQFPVRSQVQIDLTFGATAVAGAVYVGWTETTIAPMLFPRILSSSMNIPASTALQRFQIQENGVVRGVCIPHVGVDRYKVSLGNEEFVELPGPAFLGVVTGDMALQCESLTYNSVASTLASPVFSRINAGVPAPVDGSFVELVTTAAWAGVTNEVAIYAVVPNGLQGGQA